MPEGQDGLRVAGHFPAAGPRPVYLPVTKGAALLGPWVGLRLRVLVVSDEFYYAFIFFRNARGSRSDISAPDQTRTRYQGGIPDVDVSPQDQQEGHSLSEITSPPSPLASGFSFSTVGPRFHPSFPGDGVCRPPGRQGQHRAHHPAGQLDEHGVRGALGKSQES